MSALRRTWKGDHLMTTIIMEEGRVLVRDEATGRTEELRLDDTNMQEAVELIVESDDELSSRHQYCP